MAVTLAAPLAAAAYRAAGAIDPAAAATPDGGFAAAMRRAVEDAVSHGHSADAAATQSLMGQGSVADVVLAVSRAELALQTAVAIRDRVVAAYQDVMRMPI